MFPIMMATKYFKFILFILFVSGVFYAGWSANGWRINSKYLDKEIQLKNTIEVLRTSLVSVSTDLNKQREVVKERLNEVNKRVNRGIAKYIEDHRNDTPVRLNDDWVRIHDEAAGAGVPGDTTSPSRSSDAAEPVGDVEALQVITNNYHSCRVYIERLEGWQKWYSSVYLK